MPAVFRNFTTLSLKRCKKPGRYNSFFLTRVCHLHALTHTRLPNSRRFEYVYEIPTEGNDDINRVVFASLAPLQPTLLEEAKAAQVLDSGVLAIIEAINEFSFEEDGTISGVDKLALPPRRHNKCGVMTGTTTNNKKKKKGGKKGKKKR